MRWIQVFAVGVLLSTGISLDGQQATPTPAPAFRSTVNLILVDVVVRDRKGAVVTGLTSDDFQLLEDGKPQQILTFAFEQISGTARPIERASVLARRLRRLQPGSFRLRRLHQRTSPGIGCSRCCSIPAPCSRKTCRRLPTRPSSG
jgi:hypothetical protein